MIEVGKNQVLNNSLFPLKKPCPSVSAIELDIPCLQGIENKKEALIEYVGNNQIDLKYYSGPNK